MQVKDLIPGVINKLGNRTDINDSIPKWIVAVVRNLTQNFPYEELRVTGPTVQFQANVNTYPVSTFLQPGDEFGLMNFWWMYYAGTSGSGVVLKYRTPPVVASMANVTSGTMSNGFPRYWTRYGTNFMVGMTPGAAYYTYMAYQRKHPFSTNQSLWPEAQLLIPDEWQDVIEYAAAMKGAPEVQMDEKIPVWQTLLYGSGERGKPGLIKTLVSQFNRDASDNERQISVVVE